MTRDLDKNSKKFPEDVVPLDRADEEEDDKQSQPPIPVAPSDDKNPQNCFPKLNWFYIGICSSVCLGLTMVTLGAVVGDDLTWGVAIEAIVGAAIFGLVLGGLIGTCVSDPEVSQLNNELGKQ